MTIAKRIRNVFGGVVLVLLVEAAIGVGLTIWLRSWYGDYVSEAQAEGGGTPALQGLVDGLHSKAGVMLIVACVVAAVAIAFGIAAAVYLRRGIVRQLTSVEESIGSSATGLLAVVSQVASAATQTAAATNETTATVEEVRQTATLAREKAAEVADLAQQFADMCGRGQTSAEQNFSTFHRIGSDMQVVAEAIDRLNEQAESVGGIITTVNDLAEQSNLLSVNASIEAAKAGEHGKGFTVVAQEVKSLAEQSKQGVTQVRGILSEIRKASEAAVRAADESRGAVDAGRSEADSAIRNTTAEVEVARRATEATSQIVTTSHQQLAGMEQISQAMASINQAGNQVAAGTQQVQEAVRQLQDLSAALRDLIETPLFEGA